MLRCKRLVCLLMLSVLPLTAEAANTIIGFEDITTSGQALLPSPYAGFLWTNPLGDGGDVVSNTQLGLWGCSRATSAGAYQARMAGDSTNLVVTPQTGTFNFVGARFATYCWFSATLITLRGHISGGGTIEHTLVPSSTFQTVSYSDMNNLTSLEIIGSAGAARGTFLMDGFTFNTLKTSTIGFEHITTSGSAALPSPYAGFLWTNPLGDGGDVVSNTQLGLWGCSRATSAGAYQARMAGDSTNLVVTPQTGTFNFVGARFATYCWFSATLITLRGHISGGGTIEHTLVPSSTFQTVSYSDMNNLTSLEIIGSAGAARGTFLMDEFTFNSLTTSTRFYSLTPCRIFDTREPAGPTAGAPIGANQQRTFTVTNTCGIPLSALAIVTNFTVVNATAQGEVEVIAGNLTTTGTSTISVPVSRARANNATIQLSTNGDGEILAINRTAGTVHFILDVNGYFQ